MQSCRKYKLHLFTRQSGQLEEQREKYIYFITALWKVLQQNDKNIQLNMIIMLHVASESLSNFSLRR